MKGQKEAVVELVKQHLPRFIPNKDIALVMLGKDQLEAIKAQIACDIIDGNVDYSKDKTNFHEVKAYARSMVMNHLKKARELNGNQTYTVDPVATQARQEAKALSGINMDILTPDLLEFVKTLI